MAHGISGTDCADTVTGSSRSSHSPNRGARFWDRIARRYAAKPITDERAYARKLATTRTFLHPDFEVLEIGCGTGMTAVAHAPWVHHIRAVDISARMIEIARERAHGAGIDNIDFECASFDDVAVRPASLDAVLALSVLHLLPAWQDAIERIGQMLKPGGVFVSSTPCLDDAARFLKPLAPIGPRARRTAAVELLRPGRARNGDCRCRASKRSTSGNRRENRACSSLRARGRHERFLTTRWHRVDRCRLPARHRRNVREVGDGRGAGRARCRHLLADADVDPACVRS